MSRTVVNGSNLRRDIICRTFFDTRTRPTDALDESFQIDETIIIGGKRVNITKVVLYLGIDSLSRYPNLIRIKKIDYKLRETMADVSKVREFLVLVGEKTIFMEKDFLLHYSNDVQSCCFPMQYDCARFLIHLSFSIQRGFT